MVAQSAGARRGTRKRAIVPVIAGFVAVGSMFSLVSSNVMAVNFTTGNNEFKIYSNYLDAEKAAGFLVADPAAGRQPRGHRRARHRHRQARWSVRDRR